MQVSVKGLRATTADDFESIGASDLLPAPLNFVLNPSIFESLRDMLAGDVLSQTYGAFLKQTREQLRSFLAGTYTADCAHLGHTIRGTAGMLGAQQIAACAGSLENDELTPGELEEVIESIQLACASLEDALRKEQVQL